jgi:hypothetical protein
MPVSFDRVDLSWGASSDDTAVTAYTIYRDGSLLTTVGGTTTTYRDTSVSPSATYTYEVDASDAAGNRSSRSNAAAATTPPPAVFRDGFESGDLSQWTVASGVVAQQQEVASGSWAARASTSSAAAYAYRQLAQTQTELSYQLRFKVATQGANPLILQRVRTDTGTSIVKVYLDSAGKLAYRNDIAGVAATSSLVPSRGDWHTLLVRVLVNGTTGSVGVWLDGSSVSALTKTESLGTTPIGRVELSDNTGGRSFDVAFDDIVVTVPPANTALPTISGTALEGQTLTADPGTWSGTQPISYAYQWRRCDNAGANCSDISGETGASHTLTAADVGATIRVTATASNAGGTTNANSDATAVVASAPAAPSNTAPPTISGTAQEGQTLTADAGTWSGTQPISYAYQWRRCNNAGANCSDISGETGTSHTLTAADVGATIRVTVTASNAGGTTNVSSDATAVVQSAG